MWINKTWAELKAEIDSKKLAYHEVEVADHYKIYAYDGMLSLLCFVDKGTTEATEYETDYQGKSEPVSPKTTVKSIPKVAIYEPEGFFQSYVSHNLCDRTTWYQDSVAVTGASLTLDTGLTYDFPNQNIIDLEHGKVTGEKNFSFDFDTLSYTQSLRDIYSVVIYDDGVAMASGYTIDYQAGKVTLDSAPTGALTADYYYENGSNFKLEAPAGKVIQIRHVEIQFTKNITFPQAIIQQIKAYNPNDLPNKMVIENIEFLNEFDVINIGNEGKGAIPQYGALGHDVLVFPFSYGRTIDLKASTGAEINVSLAGDTPMDGDWATVTFYTSSEDE